MSALVELTDPQVFAEKMEQIAIDYAGDPEAAHSKADDLICRLLRDLGYRDGVNSFESMEKWYA